MRSRDPTTWMWEEALEMLRRADRLHRQFFQPVHQRDQCPTWEPPIDIFETEQEFTIYVALPGVKAEHLNITIEGSAVVIHGQRIMPDACKYSAIRRLEIPYGRFERWVELPAGQFEVRQRSLEDGCLMLVLSKLG